ncbi:hypothetical protein AG1IA_10354 [Rhizoctonia solani AG-1 IA]|uniref:Uncharacterized protein n=1 Tax=Thanatephorus cucumeris (strain AG1-IA) TaxID=983506 RepID=L8WBR1_THACA|nr:hypothetical protein AG1IA_10354 [Rhizoctonia solani AG-1 IA]
MGRLHMKETPAEPLGKLADWTPAMTTPLQGARESGPVLHLVEIRSAMNQYLPLTNISRRIHGPRLPRRPRSIWTPFAPRWQKGSFVKNYSMLWGMMLVSRTWSHDLMSMMTMFLIGGKTPLPLTSAMTLQ